MLIFPLKDRKPSRMMVDRRGGVEFEERFPAHIDVRVRFPDDEFPRHCLGDHV